MQQAIEKGDVLQRIAGIALIVGAIVVAVFNGLLPRADDPSQVQQVLTKLGDNETFAQIVYVCLAAGMWLLLGGIAGVYRSLSTGAAAAWARLGFYSTIVTVSVWTVVFATGLGEAGAAGNLAEKTLGTPEWSMAYSVAAAVHAVNMAVFSLGIVVQWVAIVLLGIAVSLSTLYPRWLGWIAIVLGVVTVPAIGIPQAIAGPSQTIDLLFLIFSGLTLLWALVMGILITRKAW
ncbi:hypothetical protein ACFLX9_03180 [Chloroflexota bacterium]